MAHESRGDGELQALEPGCLGPLIVPCSLGQPTASPPQRPALGLPALWRRRLHPQSSRLSVQGFLPPLPAGSTAIPSHSSCLSPTWQPHKSGPLSARSHTTAGTDLLSTSLRFTAASGRGWRFISPGHLARVNTRPNHS